MKELSPEAKSLLDAARDVDDPTPKDRERVHRALVAALGASAVGVGVASGAAASVAPSAASVAGGGATAGSTAAVVSGATGMATGASVVGTGGLTTKVLLALAVVGATSGGVWVATGDSASSTVASVETEGTTATVAALATTPDSRPGATPSGLSDETPDEARDEALDEALDEVSDLAVDGALDDRLAVSSANGAAPSETRVDPSVRRPRVAPSPSEAATPRPAAEPSAAATAGSPETLAAELALLRRARARYAAGDAVGALALLDEHARDHADGALAAERDGTRAIIRCESGRAGADESRRFAAAHPRSPLVPRVRSACESP